MMTLLAIFTALGLCLVLFLLAAALLAPTVCREISAVWLISGSCPGLEFRVRSIVLLQHLGLSPTKLVLVDCGLNGEARDRAERLAEDSPFADLILRRDLDTYFNFCE